MKNIILTILLVITISANSIAQESFSELLAKCSLSFTFPNSCIPLRVKQNPDVYYHFAMMLKTNKIEIRYTIVPFEKMERKNDLYEPYLQTMCLNITGGKMAEIQHFKHEDVSAEFNADDGLTCAVLLDSEFGKGYKYCMINVIHKDNLGDAYIFFLFDDYRILPSILTNDKIFHALKFK
jgi:hypothetical protein